MTVFSIYESPKYLYHCKNTKPCLCHKCSYLPKIKKSQENFCIFMSQEWWHSGYIWQKLKNRKKIIAFLCHKNDDSLFNLWKSKIFARIQSHVYVTSVHIYQKLKNHKKIFAFLCHKNDDTVVIFDKNWRIARK